MLHFKGADVTLLKNNSFMVKKIARDVIGSILGLSTEGVDF